jgi:plasmid stabilization system protein ParE
LKGRIARREGARRDLIAIYRHYALEAGAKTADRFLKAAEATFLRLAAMPGMEGRFSGLLADFWLRCKGVPKLFLSGTTCRTS